MQNQTYPFYQVNIFAINAAEKNNTKIYTIFNHNFKNIHCCVTIEVSVSLKRFYFALFDMFED